MTDNISIIETDDMDQCDWIVIDQLYFIPQWDEFSPGISFCLYCRTYCELYNDLHAVEGVQFWIFTDKTEAINHATLLYQNHMNDLLVTSVDSTSVDSTEEQVVCNCHFSANNDYTYMCHFDNGWRAQSYVLSMDHSISHDESLRLSEKNRSLFDDGKPRFLVAPIQYYNSCQ